MRILNIFKWFALTITSTPLLFAQDTTWFDTMVDALAALIQTAIVPLLAMGSTIVFMWGVVLFIFRAGDEKAREEGKQRMMWGIVGLFVFMTVWGLVNLLIMMVGTAPMIGVEPASFCVGDECPVG